MADCEAGGLSPAKIFARPTAGGVWLGPAQRAALSRLSQPAPLKLLTGPPSSGKSTLLGYIAAQLAQRAVVLRCAGPQQDARGLLSSLLLSAELAPWALDEVDQRNLFAVFLQQRRSQGRRVVVLVDDAHRLGAGARQEVMRLRHYRLNARPAVELILAAAHDCDWLWDEDATPAAHALAAATAQELSRYVQWRLERHAQPNPFSRQGLMLLARLSDGRYGRADALCQMTLMLLRKQGENRVDAATVREAMVALSSRRNERLAARRRRVRVAAALVNALRASEIESLAEAPVMAGRRPSVPLRRVK